MRGDCMVTAIEWHCHRCLSIIYDDFNGYYYCECGSAPSDSYSFKCNNRFHGDEFVMSSKCLDNHEVPREHVSPNVNILLLGPTGVGKSTFINALANYLTFDTLDEVLDNKLASLIYSKISITTDDYDEREVIVGDDDANEGSNDRITGQSCTQNCKSYPFPIEDGGILRIIDTPGIGDTRGVDEDKANMKDVLTYILSYDAINAICILLKPDEARLTPSLKYCIMELFVQLDKDAAKNIVLCFTNTKGTMYRPRATKRLLYALLSEISTEMGEATTIKLTRDTMYCFDSESFIFLVCSQDGISFHEQDSYRGNWKQLVDESGRLIAYIASLEPHPTEKIPV
ncbi:uncharacterized protein [Physcomitrium patens]|nr:uncharacterized protein LOC112293600 [Physcomitrium patens]|eukprot:XP_024399001.1 uncharacterized protein LOC112293600 [Physcomitrella patens]